MRVTKQDLSTITGRSTESFPDELIDAIHEVCAKYEINTPTRMAHFIAQVAHESARFVYTKEMWGPTAAQKRYEGRTDLGNVQQGDGYKYRGRGYIHLTGRHNYEEYAKDTGVDFVAEPDRVAQLPWAMDVAGWYWFKRKINVLADANDLHGVTRKINGGLNGLEDRSLLFSRSLACFLFARPDLKPVEKLPQKAPEMPEKPPATSPPPEGVLFDSKPTWASKRVWGAVIALVGLFGADTELLGRIVGEYDTIMTLAGTLVALYGGIVAKKKLRLW